MTWVVKDVNDEYLVEFDHDAYMILQARDWCMDQRLAFRWSDRNAAAHVARKLREHGAKVVRLRAKPSPGTQEKP
jgi:hypothetical protein